jgi:hypothetical protein
MGSGSWRRAANAVAVIRFRERWLLSTHRIGFATAGAGAGSGATDPMAPSVLQKTRFAG